MQSPKHIIMYFQNNAAFSSDYQEKEIILYFCNDNRIAVLEYSVIFRK